MRLFVFSKSEKGSSIITFVTYFYSFLFCRVVLQLLTYIPNFSLSEATIPFPSTSLSVPFQFAPLYERLQCCIAPVHTVFLFQFTSLYERLLSTMFLFWNIIYFNSRLSTRGYHICTAVPNRIIYFNSRLSTRGYQVPVILHRKLISYFNSRLSTRGYRMRWIYTKKVIQFQFTPLYERLPSQALTPCISPDFNSRLSTRGYIMDYSSAFPPLFQFTPLYERLRARKRIF